MSLLHIHCWVMTVSIHNALFCINKVAISRMTHVLGVTTFLAQVLNFSLSAAIALPVQYEIVVTDIERQTFQFIDFDQLILNIP